MEIKFRNKTTPCISERFCEQVKENVWLEAAGNDADSAIARVITLSTNVFLKGKDVTASGVTISAEAEATFLCLGEDSRLFSLSTKKDITIELEAPQAEANWQIIAELNAQCTNEKVINAHKVGAEISVFCMVKCFDADSFTLSEKELPDNSAFIHVKSRHEKVGILSSTAEKLFVISEPLKSRNGGDIPRKIISTEVEYHNVSCQTVSEKVIVKGEARLKLLYVPENSEIPMSEEFVLPFTQLINMGREGSSCEEITIQTTAAYINIGYAINGEKIIEAEIHAVSQMVFGETVDTEIVEGAYSNIYGCDCIWESANALDMSGNETRTFRETVRMVTENKASELVHISAKPLNSGGVPQIEIIAVFKSEATELCWARKIYALSAEPGKDGTDINRITISEVTGTVDDGGIEIQIVATAEYAKRNVKELAFVGALEIDTDEPIDFDSLPDIVLIRSETETLWELAKKFHSTVEEIELINGETPEPGTLLIIPKAK